MPRPKIEKNICQLPQFSEFSPVGYNSGEKIEMSCEEYEVIRLIDGMGLQQEECAVRMCVSRPTVQLLYTGARQKLAELLVNGKSLHIIGGSFRVCGEKSTKCAIGLCNKTEDGKN